MPSSFERPDGHRRHHGTELLPTQRSDEQVQLRDRGSHRDRIEDRSRSCDGGPSASERLHRATRRCWSHSVIKPGSGALPLPGDGGARDGQRVCHFLLRQATEVSKLHDATLTRVHRRQLAQGFVEHQDVEAGRLRRRNRSSRSTRIAAPGRLAAGAHARSRPECGASSARPRIEVATVLPRHPV